MSKKPNAAMLAAMKADAPKPSEDKLDKIRDVLREMRVREMQNLEAENTLRENSEWLRNKKEKELVDLFDEAGIDRLGLPAEGNFQKYEIELKPYYHANIAEAWDDDKKSKAYDYLDAQKAGDMIKATYTIAFGMKERKAQKAFEQMLKKAKIQFSSKFGVPWNSLTAWLKDQVENHEKMPNLEVIGGKVGRQASVVKQKKEK